MFDWDSPHARWRVTTTEVGEKFWTKSTGKISCINRCTINCVKGRPVTRNQEGRSPSGKMCLTYFETIGHSLKIFSPSQKTLRPLVSQAGYQPATQILYSADNLWARCFCGAQSWEKCGAQQNKMQLTKPASMASSVSTASNKIFFERNIFRTGLEWRSTKIWDRALIY